MAKILKESENEEEISYIVQWSPFYELEKYHLLKKLPSEGGIIQIFYKKNRLLHLAATDNAYYGGIRNTVLELLDELSPRVFPYKDELKDKVCFVRYAVSPRHDEILDVLHFLKGSEKKSSKGIFVMEKETMKISRAVRGKMIEKTYSDSILY